MSKCAVNYYCTLLLSINMKIRNFILLFDATIEKVIKALIANRFNLEPISAIYPSIQKMGWSEQACKFKVSCKGQKSILPTFRVYKYERF